MRWKPTSPDLLIRARKLDGQVVEFRELQPGDAFRAIAPDGQVIHPVTGEPDDEVVSLVTDPPIRNDANQIGSILGARGYGVPIEVYPTMDELKRRGLS